MVSCANAEPAAAAAIIAAAQTPHINFLVSNMALPSLLSSPGRRRPLPTSPACRKDGEGARRVFVHGSKNVLWHIGRPHLFTLACRGSELKYHIDATLKGPSGRRDTEASDKWFRHDKPVIHDFQRQRR